VNAKEKGVGTEGLEPNSPAWWDVKGRNYAGKADMRDRPAEFKAAAAMVVGSTVMEIGPAFGAFADYLDAGTQYVGVELGEYLVGEARKRRPDRLFVQGDFMKLGKGWHGSVDTAVAFQFLEHFKKAAPVLAQARRIARKRLVFNVPRQALNDTAVRNDGHLSAWACEADVLKAMEGFGKVTFWKGAANHICAAIDWNEWPTALEKLYTKQWVDGRVTEKKLRWARVMVATMLRDTKPRSVLDLGAGAFSHVNLFSEAGVDAMGIESGRHALVWRGPDVRGMAHDLSTPLLLDEQFDLVTTFEVAEHIARRYEGFFFDNVLRHAKRFVAFSAATPKQAGLNHVNCRPHKYWVKRFEAAGWELVNSLTDKWRAEWEKAGIRRCYYRNVMVFRPVKKEEAVK